LADEREEIRARIDIVDLVGRSRPLKRAGKHWKGLCPFHEDKNPSFFVSPDTGRYRCWSCGETGDIFTWVMKTQNVDFVEAMRLLAKEAGVELSTRGTPESRAKRESHEELMAAALEFFRAGLHRSPGALDYCRRRGLDEAVLQEWELGFAPDQGEALAVHLKKNGFSLADGKELFLVDQDASGGYFDKFRGRLIFPIRDERGALVAFGGRLLGDGQPKYINSSDTPLYRKSRVLYGMHRARERLNAARQAVLVEGYLDVIACHRAGVTSALASLGTSLSEDHAKLLKRWCESVVILYDSDAAGQKAAERAVGILRAEGVKVRVALMPPGDDPDTLLRSEGPAAVQRAVEQGLTPTEYRVQATRQRLSPETEEFWEEVIEALAEAPTELEVDSQIERLAPLYPGIRDRVRAQQALKRDVSGRRRRVRERVGSRPPATPAFGMRYELTAPEAVVLRSFVDQDFRRLAWMVTRNAQLFETSLGVSLCEAIHRAFPEGPPEGPASAWLHRIEPEALRDALGALEFDVRSEKIGEGYLADSVQLLKQRLETRSLAEMQQGQLDDGKRQEILERLRRLKPDSRVVEREDDRLF
jgi:DNA primase